MEPLQPAFRRQLRARAHALHPVVAIGHHGLTPSVIHEIDVALTAHELIKVRVFNDDRSERDALLARIADALDCAPVQQIGKLLVLWRPRPTSDQPAKDPASKQRDPRDRSPPVRRRRRTASVHASTPTGTTRARKPAPKTPFEGGTPVGRPSTRGRSRISGSNSSHGRSPAAPFGASPKKRSKPSGARVPKSFNDASGSALRRRRRAT